MFALLYLVRVVSRVSPRRVVAAITVIKQSCSRPLEDYFFRARSKIRSFKNGNYNSVLSIIDSYINAFCSSTLNVTST
jgi:hypothetical protein